MFVLSSAIHEVRFDNNDLGISCVWDCDRTIRFIKDDMEVVEVMHLDPHEDAPSFQDVHAIAERYFCDANTNGRRHGVPS